MDDTYYIPVNQRKPVHNLLEHLSSVVSQHRIRLKEPFQDFDRLHSHTVTRNQFFQVLKVLRLGLETKQMEQLADRYTVQSTASLPKHEQKVNWHNFVRDVEMGGEDEVELEKKPSKEPQRAQKQRAADFFNRRQQNSLTAEEFEQFKRIMRRLRHVSKERGIIIKKLFRDLDRLNHGTVTKAQFVKSLPFPNLPMSDINILVKRYEDREGYVDYFVFHNEVMGDEPVGELHFEGEDVQQVVPPKGTAKKLFHYESEQTPESVQADAVEEKLQQLVLKYSIRIEEALRDYDSLRKGYITVPQFKAAIGSVKFPKYTFSAKQLDALADKYLHVDDQGKESVHYSALLDRIYRLFTEKNLEKRPTVQVNRPSHLLSTSKPKLPDQFESRVNQLLSKIRHIARTKRLFMKNDFLDFDRATKGTHSEYITPTRFERALDNLGLRFSTHDYKVLCAKYDDQNNGDVNFRMFLQDVDFDEEDGEGAKSSSGYIPPAQRKSKSSATIELQDVIQRVQHRIVKDRIRLIEWLVDHDPLRHGRATKNKFRAALSQAGIELTDEEYKLICESYQDFDHKDQVRYSEFLNDVESVEQSRSLEKNPLAETPNTNEFLNTRSFRTQNVEGLSRIIRRLKHCVKTHGIFMKPVFQSYDRFKFGKISKAQFRVCIDQLFGFLSEADVEKLMNAYYNSDQDYVMYMRFVSEVDPSETDNLKETSNTSNNAQVQHNSKKQSKQGPQLDPTLESIRSQIRRNRIRLKDYFLDFDQRRKGYVTPNRFQSVLSTCKIVLSQDEMDLLSKEFVSETSNLPNAVDYVAFLKAVDE